MKKRIIAIVLAFCFILPCAIPCYAADASGNEYCLHDNAKWKLLSPPTLISEMYYYRKCPDCGFYQTAMKSRTSLPEMFFDIVTRLLFIFEQPHVNENFKVTAHSGAFETVSNSMESLRYCLQSGADMIEIDLNLNSDGVAVLSHDEPDSSAVTLDEAFAFVAKYVDVQVNVDIKNIYAVEQVQELGIKYGITDRLFYTGAFEDDFAYIKEHSPLVRSFLNAACDPDPEKCAQLCDKAVELGAVGLNFNYNDCSEELISAAHERGLLVSIYTINSRQDTLKYLQYDVDYMTTLKPYLAYTFSNGLLHNFHI